MVLENVQALCSDLSDDFYSEKNEKLLEKYGNDEFGLWISMFGARIQAILDGTKTLDYLRNLMGAEATLNNLVVAMNEGNIPDEIVRNELENLIVPLKDGLLRS